MIDSFFAIVVMSGRESTRRGGEPELKRRRLLDAGGPIEDDETARQKMRDAKVRDEMRGDITGFDPEEMGQKKYAWCSDGVITPMGYFAGKGDLPMMRWLYANGADTRDEDVEHWFPIYAASLSGQLDACKWLFDHGADNDVKRRTSNDVSPLCVTFDKSYWRVMSRWLILMGALCKDGSSDLDLGLVKKDLNRCEGCVTERHLLLEWAIGRHQTRQAFLVFLMGTISPHYSPLSLHKLLAEKLESEEATDRILDALPSNQHQQLWDDLLVAKQRSCPLRSLSGSLGVFETIGNYVGIVQGREARIIRQLTEILPELKKLDQKY